MSTASTPSGPKPIHLLVLLHGMWGNPSHVAEMDRIYNELRGQDDSVPGPNGERLHTLLAQTNKESSTYDGIDWGGERVAEEIFEEIKKLEEDNEKVTRISITGYSQGGLIGRYLVGVLHQRKLFDKVTPVNFTTVATPHIGMVLFPTFRSRMFHSLGTRLLSRTGEQFYVKDKWSATGRPLLEVMADPNRVFAQALSLFSHVRFYANAVNDTTVPYLSSAVELEDPFADHATNGMHIELDEQYSPLIKSYSIPDVPKTPPPKPKAFTKEWFHKFEPQLPPVFQKKFPWNILILVSLPLLVPAMMTLIVLRLSLDARSSRSRIKLLEKEESYRNRLVHVVAELEKRVEDAVVEYMDDPGRVAAPIQDPVLTPSSETHIEDEPTTNSQVKMPQASSSVSQPTITDVQKRMVISLNKLPNLKKELVYIHPVFNSHAVIIARDVKRFEQHKQGLGVLRHLADNFVM